MHIKWYLFKDRTLGFSEQPMSRSICLLVDSAVREASLVFLPLPSVAVGCISACWSTPLVEWLIIDMLSFSGVVAPIFSCPFPGFDGSGSCPSCSISAWFSEITLCSSISTGWGRDGSWSACSSMDLAIGCCIYWAMFCSPRAQTLSINNCLKVLCFPKLGLLTV